MPTWMIITLMCVLVLICLYTLICLCTLGAYLSARADRKAQEDYERLVEQENQQRLDRGRRLGEIIEGEFRNQMMGRKDRYRRQAGRREMLTSNPHQDPGFDASGFALGMATGAPISPSQGISSGAMLGAAMHQQSQSAPVPVEPTPAAAAAILAPASKTQNGGRP
jgi:hypothetical protein